ncbi:MAG TPA: DUF4190 domain-containing protein [Candidatus Limnocylindria bacterium]|nr:DUF4190 domain-containing protein [Candidatus Limnocylindria bacterium]
MSAPAKTSGLAIASLVCGILCFTGIGPILGLVFGILAKSRISKSAGRLKGDGLALAGIIVSATTLVLVLAGMLLPALDHARPKAQAKAQPITSASNLKQLGLAARIHATDHGSRFLAAADWVDTLRPELEPDADTILHRPDDALKNPCGYGYNLQMAGVADDSVNPQTVLFFELETPRCNAAGGRELLRQPKRSGDAVGVCFADGSVQLLPPERLAQLRWSP